MTSNRKYTNISIQPAKLQRTSKTLFELPDENLNEAELYGKSTSDRTKRRVAHEAWFPLPAITKPIAPVKVVAQPKPQNKGFLKKSVLCVKPCKVRQINETVTLDSSAQHSKSTSSDVDDRVKVNKRKLEDLDSGEVMKKKQNNELEKEKKRVSEVKVNKRKLGDLYCDEITKKKLKKAGKKEKKSKGVDEVKANKRKLGDLDCGEVTQKKQKKEGKKEKKRVYEVEADKRKLGDLDCDEVTKLNQNKANVDKSKNKDVKQGKKLHSRKST